MEASTNAVMPKYVCGNDRLKMFGTIDGYFPDFGHHLEGEMGGLWLYPVKLLDGFWMKLSVAQDPLAGGYIRADSFRQTPYKNEFFYRSGLGHTVVEVKRTQFAPENVQGLYVIYDLVNTDGTPRDLSLEFLFRTDLRPCWLSEKAGLLDGSEDVIRWNGQGGYYLAKDCGHDWYVAVGSDRTPSGHSDGQFFGPEVTRGNGVSGRLEYQVRLGGYQSERLVFRIAGSLHSAEDCEEQYRMLDDAGAAEESRKKSSERLVSRSRIRTGDPSFDEVFDWVKVHMNWLTLQADGIGRGIAAGLPEYPWWFGCDSFYALQGLVTLGDFDLCRSTLKILLDQSERLNGDGRIIHEILPNGISPNLGNTQETAHFIVTLWEYFRWSGDAGFLRECYPYISKSVRWLRKMDDDGDLFPSGYGIIEIAGLNMEMIDTAVYSSAAMGCYAKITRLLGEGDGKEWEDLSRRAVKNINELFWIKDQHLYADCFASSEKIRSSEEQILRRAPRREEYRGYLDGILQEHQDGREHGWLLQYNWVINTPMEAGIADSEHAREALEAMDSDRFIGPYGMYLSGYEHSAAMTVSTGVMAVAQARYGYPDRALDLIRRMFSTFSRIAPGALAEMSPDYGCFVQAWTCYGAMVPAVKYFFGIQPDASERKIILDPCLPSSWRGRGVSIERVKVFDGMISMKFFNDGEGEEKCRVKYSGKAEISVPDQWKGRMTIIRENS
ncbi:MAG: amylo-alpha-1,6-glucosidase [Lachnospiraceae bacterium]|jgi:hypothetical protein